MASQQGAGGSSDGGLLAVESPQGLALLEVLPEVPAAAAGPQAVGVMFDGIALGPGVYVDAAGRRVRVRASHLPLVAERLPGVFLRDLHREDLGASIGIVTRARVEEGEVRFTGDVRLAPYVELVRHFWQHIRFSLGFRYDPAKLVVNEDGTYDLPSAFLIDHLALVPQGQYPNARLVRLLNQARGLAPSPSFVAGRSSGEHQRADVKATPAPQPRPLAAARGAAAADAGAAGQRERAAAAVGLPVLSGDGQDAAASPPAKPQGEIPPSAKVASIAPAGGPDVPLRLATATSGASYPSQPAQDAAAGAPTVTRGEAALPPTRAPLRAGQGVRQAGPHAPSPRPPATAHLSFPSGGTTMLAETENLEQLRQQRDDALRVAEQSKIDLEQARGDLGKAKADLEAASRLAEAARLELGQAKNRLAAEVMKLELGAGKDFDLDQRKKELTGLDLAALDRLRGELRLSAADTEDGEEEPAGAGPLTVPAEPAAGAAPTAGAMNLEALPLNDALRLALRQGVF